MSIVSSSVQRNIENRHDDKYAVSAPFRGVTHLEQNRQAIEGAIAEVKRSGCGEAVAPGCRLDSRKVFFGSHEWPLEVVSVAVREWLTKHRLGGAQYVEEVEQSWRTRRPHEQASFASSEHCQRSSSARR